MSTRGIVGVSENERAKKMPSIVDKIKQNTFITDNDQEKQMLEEREKTRKEKFKKIDQELINS